MKMTLFIAAALLAAFFLAPVATGAQVYIINTIAGNGGTGFSGDGGLSTFATFNSPEGVVANRAGTVVYVADELNHRIRRVVNGTLINTCVGTGPTGTTVGGYGGDGGAAGLAQLNAPFGIALDSTGNLYIADNQNYRIRVVNTAGIINTICGTGVAGYTGDGGPATMAKIGYSQGITVDPFGNIYYSDLGYNVVRKINTAGIITTVAGNGVADSTGDGGPATLASLSAPRGLAADRAGNLYIADVGNNRIRKVSPSGSISTFLRNSAWDVKVNAAGDLFYSGGASIFQVTGAGVPVRYYTAIDSPSGFSGDGCVDTFAKTNTVSYFALDSAGDVFFTDFYNVRIREVSKNHAPFFPAGHSQTLTMCEDSVALLNTQLSVIDSDYHQWEEWQVISGPSSGTLFASAVDTSDGGTLTPPGFTYAPTTGYSGGDAFQVVITDCTGASDTTSVTVVVNNCSLGVGHLAGPGTALQVFPNPGSGLFTFRVNAAAPGMATITLTDLLGRAVQQFALPVNTSAPVSCTLAPGIYFVTAVTAAGQYSARLEVR